MQFGWQMLSGLSKVDNAICVRHSSLSGGGLANKCLNIKCIKEYFGHTWLLWRRNFIVCQSHNWLLVFYHHSGKEGMEWKPVGGNCRDCSWWCVISKCPPHLSSPFMSSLLLICFSFRKCCSLIGLFDQSSFPWLLGPKPIRRYRFRAERECLHVLGRGWDNELGPLFPLPVAPGDGISLKEAERKSLWAVWMTSQRWERISLLPLSLSVCVFLSLSLSSFSFQHQVAFSSHKGVSFNPITLVLNLTDIKIIPPLFTKLRISLGLPPSLNFHPLRFRMTEGGLTWKERERSGGQLLC